MSSFDRILTLLKSTKLYSYSDKSLVLAEMNAYAEAFDTFQTKVDTLLDHSFLDKVSGKYYNKYEQLFGFLETMVLNTPEGIATSTEKIKLMKARLSITNNDFSMASVKKCIETLGLEANIVENVANKSLTVTVVKDHEYISSNQDDQRYWIRKYLPYHSTSTINFALT